ncbi:MAG: RrF2 family transcriptional regulator [Christensenellales bacterium]
MKLSTKSRYGIRAMLSIALNEEERPIPISQIAEQQNIPGPYLEQLAGTLKRSGLVVSTRGALGGYRLSREPKDISIGEIIRALEGSLAPLACVEDEELCSHSGNCTEHMLYGRITRGVNDVFDSISLNDLVSDQRRLEGSAPCNCAAAGK